MTVEQTFVFYDGKKKEKIIGVQGLVTTFIFEHFKVLGGEGEAVFVVPNTTFITCYASSFYWGWTKSTVVDAFCSWAWVYLDII